jgi:hypothetical protein
MNNTKTTLAAIAAFLIAATLVVGGTFAATTTHPAFAYSKNKGHEGDKNSKNGNTVTIQKCEQKASQSGFDNDQAQECENLICTHPGSNATCVSESEGAAVSNQTGGGGGGVCKSPLVLARIDGVSICVDPSTLIPPVGGKCEAPLIAVTVDDTVIGCISLSRG